MWRKEPPLTILEFPINYYTIAPLNVVGGILRWEARRNNGHKVVLVGGIMLENKG